LQRIRELGALAGVAYNPATPLSSLPYVAELADLVLIMSVNPGFGGQRFIGSALDKVRVASRIMAESGHQAEIEVDGGIGTANAGAVTAAGATVLVAGTAVYGAPDVGTAIAAIRSAAHSRQA
jgi:ribulose-phosphate 3-epimerase